MFKKKIIVFEGVEGSGKSYHLNNVSNYLRKKKIKFIKIREPGGHINSEKIRKLILNKKSKFNKNTDLLLYLASRSENIQLIRKHMSRKIILIDRFVDSTIAYQHYGLGADINLVNTLNKHLLKNFKVDFTFLNIVNKENMKKRLKLRKSLNRYDKFNMTFYNKVQNGFIKMSKLKKNRYKLINSNLDIKNNEKLILNIIDKLI